MSRSVNDPCRDSRVNNFSLGNRIAENGGHKKPAVKNFIKNLQENSMKKIVKMDNLKESNTEIITVSPDFLDDSSVEFKDPMSDSSNDDLEMHSIYQEDPEVIVVCGDEFDQSSDSDLEFIEEIQQVEPEKSKLINDINSTDVVVKSDILNDLLEGRVTKTTKKLLESTKITYLPMQLTQSEFRSTYSNDKSPFKVRPVKANKGLRHFSKRVCDKVKTKMVTTYKEVADELVAECVGNNESPSFLYDQKNIRRRVYDALNVLMALDIITKNKKDITWKGLPTGSIQNSVYLVQEKENRLNNVKRKLLALQEIIMQEVAVKRLVKRNQDMENEFGPPPKNTFVNLPFIAISASEDTVVEVEISEDQKQYGMNFNDKFSVIDDTELLKSMGFTLGLDCGEVSNEDLKVLKTLVPKAFEKHIVMMATKNGEMFNDICKEFDEKIKAAEIEQTPSRPNIINRRRNKR
ncbi:Transcription factor DP, C-terminal,Winged helix-turn-helix DNA-binding domain,E2F/DP family, winged-helix [Cinara cedri]|uniref:Transcription factor DP, C-terminal,Winged helix-turn-helix DNA-binding domain,E2F/DP family, winged-helix n=1 Tax=Cinara cedri TaxID=506608 RepID=A0A5E4N212_9HEMI|nr:Transcription factor DP, C-terminal,Winged helix-turn-helix DNA-binding domain,E2F/DP family, winged-helix [Cinara cedri]